VVALISIVAILIPRRAWCRRSTSPHPLARFRWYRELRRIEDELGRKEANQRSCCRSWRS